MAGAQATGSTRQAAQGLLGIYLNDHLAGATGGMELARRVAAARREEEAGDALLRFAADVAADRATLLEIMTALDVLRSYQLHANAYLARPATFDLFTEVIQQVAGLFLSLARLPVDPGPLAADTEGMACRRSR